MDHGNRRAPHTLAADQPIAQAIVHRGLADALLLQPRADLFLGDIALCAAEGARVDHGMVGVMKQHILIERFVLQQVHGNGRLARAAGCDGLTASYDLLIVRHAVQLDDSVVKNESHAAASHIQPLARRLCLLRHRQVGIHLRGSQADLESVIGFHKRNAGGRQRRREVSSDMILPGHTLAHAIGAGNDGDDRQAVLDREGEVAFIMGGHSHDRARAVGHQHIVGNPHRDAFAVDRVRGKAARENAGFVFVRGHAVNIALAAGLGAIGLHGRGLRLGRQRVHQRMFRRQHHEGRAPQRIRARGEDLNRVAAGSREDHACALAAANPVGLQHLHPFRPLHAAEIQQFFGVIGDLEEPLIQFLFDDRRAAAFAVAVFAPNLLARQGGIALRAEVHRGKCAISQSGFVQAQEEPLRPFVIVGIAGDGLTIPGKHGAHRAQLLAHVLDVRHRPGCGVNAALDCGIFRRQAKGIEAHGKEDVVALHTLETRGRVRGGHGVPMTDVQIARWIGQHGQKIPFGPLFGRGACQFPGLIDARLIPSLLPFRLEFLRCVAFIHGLSPIYVLRCPVHKANKKRRSIPGRDEATLRGTTLISVFCGPCRLLTAAASPFDTRSSAS